MTALRLQTFGALALTRDGGIANEAKIQRKPLAVLAVLAAESPAGVSRERLTELFWGDKEIDGARASMTMALHMARKAFRDDDVVLEGQSALHLNAELLPSDVAEYNGALASGDRSAAVQLYTGAFLGHLYLEGSSAFERWRDQKQTTLEESYVRSLTELAEEAKRAGGLEAAVGFLRRAVETRRHSASLTVAYMEALDAAGERGSALDAGRVYSTLITMELGTEPDPEVLRLMSRLRAAMPVKPSAPTPAVRPITVAPPPAPLAESENAQPPSREELADDSTPSIAVLPFQDVSAEQGDAMYEIGIMDEVIAALTRLRTIRVPSRSSVLAQMGRKHELPALAAALGVRTLLHGTVRRDARLLRVTVELTRASDGVNLWRASIREKTGDALPLLDTVAQEIAQALHVSIVGWGTRPRGGASAEGYESYLRGQHLIMRRHPDGIARAIALLEAAVARDPGYAPAHAALAEAFHVAAVYAPVRPSDVVPRAREEARIAHELDPCSPLIGSCLAMTHYYARRFGDAAREAGSTLDLDPRFVLARYFLGRTDIERERLSSAIETFEQLAAATDGAPVALAQLGFAHARAGDEEEARAVLARLEGLAPPRFTSGFDTGLVRIGLGDIDGALDDLESALEQRSPFAIWLGVQPGLDSVREEPRYHTLLSRMGLPR